jgi:mRNA-degrading endonuclease RelE of RelBE toxin-antitoxin system
MYLLGYNTIMYDIKQTERFSKWLLKLKVHHAKLVTAWIEEHKEEIAIFYLPPYSP